jgi:hypothetical protein
MNANKKKTGSRRTRDRSRFRMRLIGNSADGSRLFPGLVHDLDRAGLDDEEVDVLTAGLEEVLTILQAPEFRQWAPSQRGHPGLVESGKGHGVPIVLGRVSTSGSSICLASIA